MKKVALAVVILVIIISYLALRDNSPKENQAGLPIVSESGVPRHPDPSSATFIFDDGPITLLVGRNEKVIASGSALVEETVLLDKFAYGDINADGKEDTVLFLARYGAGSGTFIYLASFVSGPITYRGSKVTFLGDRIVPQSISINGETITVRYLDRGADEAFVDEPTVPTTKQFVYVVGEFQEK